VKTVNEEHCPLAAVVLARPASFKCNALSVNLIDLGMSSGSGWPEEVRYDWEGRLERLERHRHVL
jgi:hypothetical protein